MDLLLFGCLCLCLYLDLYGSYVLIIRALLGGSTFWIRPGVWALTEGERWGKRGWSSRASGSGFCFESVYRHSPHGCFCKLEILFVGVLIIKSLLSRVYIRAPDFRKIPEVPLLRACYEHRPACSSAFAKLSNCGVLGLCRAIGPSWHTIPLRRGVGGSPRSYMGILKGSWGVLVGWQFQAARLES